MLDPELQEIIEERPAWSASEAGRIFAMQTGSVTSKLNAHAVNPIGTRKGRPVYAPQDVARAIFTSTRINPDSKDFDPEALPPAPRKAWYEGEVKRIALARENGELVSLDAYREEISTVVKSLVQFLETLPDELERNCSLPAEAVEEMERMIDKQREHFVETCL